MRVIMRFSKGEEIKYISHLDLQRLFQRALRRAKLPCAYSQGFNPHMIISFACALPLGVCSSAEYAEIQLEKYVHPSDVMKKMNEVLPAGVKILNAIEPKEGYPNVGSVIALAEYTFENDGDASEILKEFLSKSEIMVEKKTKKGQALVNVRPMIHRLTQTQDGIKATLSCSNSENLRADKLQELLNESGIEIRKTERNSIFIINEGRLEEPIAVN